MAEPFLRCPRSWTHGTLEPDPASGLIAHAESGSTPSTAREDFWDGGIPWLTPKEITGMTDGVFVSRTERTLSKLGIANCAAKLQPTRTVMLTKRAPVGAVALNAVPMATNQGFINFRCGPLVRPLYLAYWFRANRSYLELVANGSTYPELYLTDLFEFEIAVPSLEKQDRIVDVISAMQFLSLLRGPLEQSVADPVRLAELQEQGRKLGTLRDALLPALLSGDLDPTEVAPSRVARRSAR